MVRTLNEVLDSLSPERRDRIEQRSEELLADYEAVQKLQEILKVSDEISLDALRQSVEALGGTLEVVVNWPGKSPIKF
ncbi:MAG: hypothetical protein ACLFSH_01065 [Phormidium sp.]